MILTVFRKLRLDFFGEDNGEASHVMLDSDWMVKK